MVRGVLAVCHALHKTEAEVRDMPLDEMYRHLVYIKLQNQAKAKAQQ